MTDKTIELRIMAFDNAAEMIKGHPESSWGDIDQGGIPDYDEAGYMKACDHAFKAITKLADKLRQKQVR